MHGTALAIVVPPTGGSSRPGAPRRGRLLAPAALVGLLLSLPVPLLAAPTAVHGLATVGESDVRAGVALGGQWEIYWGRLLTPADFADPSRRPAPSLITVPSSWNTGGTGFSVSGFATYRLVVKLPFSTDQPLGLYLASIGTAYRLYVNGTLLLENGVVSEDLTAVRGTYAPRAVYLSASDRLEIVLQVANAEDNVAGLESSPVLSLAPSIVARSSGELLRDGIIYAIVLAMGLYHILLAILNPAEKASLSFGLLAVTLALRGALTGARILHQFASGIGFHTLISAEFITVYAAGLMAYLYFAFLFPKERIRFVLVPILAASVACSIVAVVAPIPFIVSVHFFYEILLLAEGLLIVVWLVRAIVARRDGAVLMLAAFLVMLGSAAYDIILNMRRMGGLYISSYAMVFFVLMQAVLIARRYAQAYTSSSDHARKAEGLAEAYGRFVPRQFLGLLGKDSIESVNLGDQIQLDLTVLFSDIKAFTSLSENMTPRENFNFLNSFLSRVSPVVRRNRGFIDKYLGDGIMALFPRSPMDAVRAALELMETIRVFNGHRANSGYRPIDIGVGINTGSLMLGTVGESSRMDGTVISDSVNLASRLEGLTRVFGAHILVGENVLAACPEAEGLPHRCLGRVQVKGKANAVTVFEIIDEPDAARVATRASFEQALNCFEARRYKEAAVIFRAVTRSDPGDEAARYYLKRIIEELRSERASSQGRAPSS